MTAVPSRDPMSLDDWRALGEDTSQRCELSRGMLMMSPRPRLRHLDAQFDIGTVLSRQIGKGLRVTLEPDVVVDPRTPATVRVPDVVVRRSDAADPLTAADVLVVIEILSSGTRRVDLVTKRGEYAAAGIAHYWIVDVDARRMLALTLVDGVYVGDWSDGTFTASSPFAASIDLTGL